MRQSRYRACGSCQTCGRPERAHRSLQNRRRFRTAPTRIIVFLFSERTKIRTLPPTVVSYPQILPRRRKTKPLKEWGLKDYLDVANELGWIRQSAKDVGQVLRDYRNYIHPEKELSHGITVDGRDTAMFVTVFCSIAEQIIASA